MFLFPTPAFAQGPNFLTLVYPVRGRNLWEQKEFYQLDPLFSKLKNNNLKATFLLQYDAATDNAVTNTILEGCPSCELGIFMEVSEQLATDSQVAYNVGSGNWARPDKTFLSGYSILDREKLIDTMFKQFKSKFGYYPTTVGAWYIDPFSLNYAHDKYGVIAQVSVADQLDTDGQSYWGKPWGTPFYPNKYNILAEADNLKNKLDIVQIQWAQRHPTDGYGTGVKVSRNSLQANDYINNNKDSSYFSEILNDYLNPDNQFNQVTIGLEVGQELNAFIDEHLKQLKILEQKKLTSVTVGEFANWYRKNYPLLSPIMRTGDNKTLWVATSCYRVGIKDQQIFDLRSYAINSPEADFLNKDPNFFLDRQLPNLIPKPIKINGTNHLFLDTKFSVGSQSYDFSSICQPNNYISDQIPIVQNTFDLSFIKTSVLSGQRILGFQIGPDRLLGFWVGHGAGVFNFPFQTLVRFQPLTGIKKW